MLRSSRATHVSDQPPSYHSPEVRVRIGLEEAAYSIQQLTSEGFSIAPAAARTPGMRMHASFILPGGLSISFEVVARASRKLSGLQQFDFVDADPDLLDLLLTTADTDVVH